MLVSSLYKKGQNKNHKIAFMPHWSHEAMYDFDPVCEQYNIHYSSPKTVEVEKVIDEIYASGVIIAEAMYSAIIADALRVPWVPNGIYGINYFKWLDWCESLKLEYSPIQFFDKLHNSTKIKKN